MELKRHPEVFRNNGFTQTLSDSVPGAAGAPKGIWTFMLVGLVLGCLFALGR